MEFLIAIALGVLIAALLLQVLGFPEKLARAMIVIATAQLPGALRERVIEECQSEIRATENVFGQAYIAVTFALDAAHLRHLWRTEQLRSLAKESESEADDPKSRKFRKYMKDLNSFGMREELTLAPVQPFEAARLDGQKVSWKDRMSLSLRPRFREPRYRDNQKIFKTCHGKVFRLEGGIWTADW